MVKWRLRFFSWRSGRVRESGRQRQIQLAQFKMTQQQGHLSRRGFRCGQTSIRGFACALAASSAARAPI
jgi:hypothetical protein